MSSPALPTHPVATCPSPRIALTTGDLRGEATAHSTSDGEEASGMGVSVVVSVHCLRSVGDHGGGVDLLHHRARDRVR